MHFKLDFDIKQPLAKINIEQSILMLGSCFAEHIGTKLTQHKFNVDINPNGIVFNPLSIIRALQSYINGKLYDEKDLFFYNDLWYSWDHHGMFADASQIVALQKINRSQEQAMIRINNADHMILTLGSAYVYELKETKAIVSNCHKVPQQNFNKRLLGVKEIISAFEDSGILDQKFRIIFTISPVRYIRDGLVENNHSKAILIQAVHELCERYSNCCYFPAYEIVIDELRDYRFFDKDLVHPNELAIDYVWERFCETMVDDGTKRVLKEIKQIILARQHKPFNADIVRHKQFLKTYYKKIIELTAQYPFLRMEEDRRFFEGEE